jgi:26S proteasome regulatory subunit T1
MKIKAVEDENKKLVEEIKKESGIKESDTGLALPSQWNIVQDKQLLSEKPLSVAMCTKIIDKNTPNPKYLINLR